MSSHNRNRFGVAAMALLVLGTICAIRFGHKTTVTDNTGALPAKPPAASPPASAKSLESHSSESSQLVYLSRNQVLATVNGSVIRLADIVPTSDTNSTRQITLDKVTLDYYLKRAVDRELILQKAQQQGIALDESQHERLAAYQAMRNQPEPGGIARLNDSAAANQLESQDSTAFMLETTLMAAQGLSPNVTEDQVTAYYNQHASEFGGQSLESLQQDPQLWQQVDAKIRNELAPSVRAAYNNQVANFMHNLESHANITMTPIASL